MLVTSAAFPGAALFAGSAPTPQESLLRQLLLIGCVLLGLALLLRAARRIGMAPRSLFLLGGVLIGALQLRVPLLGGDAAIAQIGVVAAAMALFATGIAQPVKGALGRPILLALLLAVGAAAFAFAAALGCGLQRPAAMLFGAGAALLVTGTAIDAHHDASRTGKLVSAAALLGAPIAAALVTLASARLSAPDEAAWDWLSTAALSLAGGAVLGVLIGGPSARFTTMLCGTSSALQHLLLLSTVFLCCAAAMALDLSPLMTLVMAGMILGSGLPSREQHFRTQARALARCTEAVCLLLMGLLMGRILEVRLVAALPWGLAAALLLSLVARPCCVFLLTRSAGHESWLAAALRGPRGGVLLLLACMIPLQALAAMPIGRGPGAIFDILLTAALLDTLFHDALDAWLRRRGPAALRPAEVRVVIESERRPEGLQATVRVAAESGMAGRRLLEVAMPEDVSVLLIEREGKVLPARGWSELKAGDTLHLYGGEAAIAGVEALAGNPQA